MQIFILLSIKTRIETLKHCVIFVMKKKFLSYYPLKQGLKLGVIADLTGFGIEFLSYYPLKQGLKP